jgi:metal-sulfur cluster biosynthetic enzyme
VSNPDVLEVLKGVTDPEIGVNIVDLGLVYRAEHGPEGIEVALTLSTPSCPLSEMIVEEVRELLKANFADAPAIKVELVWDPPWTPDRMSEAARQLLGRVRSRTGQDACLVLQHQRDGVRRAYQPHT